MRRMLLSAVLLVAVSCLPCWAVSLREAQEAVQKAFPRADPMIQTYFAYILLSLPEGESIGIRYQGSAVTFSVEDDQIVMGDEQRPIAGELPLDVDEGATVGDWVLWRTAEDRLLATHPEAGIVVEFIASSNGWVRWAQGDTQIVVFTPNSWEDQEMDEDRLEYLARDLPQGSLGAGTYGFGKWEIRCLADKLEVENEEFSDVVVIHRDRPQFEYVDEDGVSLKLPEGIAEHPRLSQEPPVLEDELFGLAVGEGATYGQWVIWHATERMALFVHPQDKVAFEIARTSNGWFDFAQGDRQWIAWSIAETEPEPMEITDYRSYFDRQRPERTLGPMETSFGAYQLNLTEERLEVVNNSGNETIIVTPDESAFRFRGITDKVLVLPRDAYNAEDEG